MKLRQISIRIARTDAEHAEALLNLAGTLALRFDDAQDTPLFEPDPGSTPLWPHLIVHALFPADFDVITLGALLQHTLPSAENIETTIVDKGDWQAGLEQEVFVQHIAPNLSIVPADWEGPDSAVHVVRLHMGLAFGTGRHATTRLCLDWLAANPPRGLEICDFGCGSGVLAIAALQLGATHAVAIDNEPQAIAATLANATLNAVEERIAAGSVSDFAERKVDLVLANILAGTLEQSVDVIASMLKPRGHVVLSGILAEQAGALTRCFAQRFESLITAKRDGWARIAGILR